MKDKDHKMLEEAWKQVYVEEPNMSPEEAQEAHGRGETLMVTTADGVEFIVDPHNDDTIEADPQNGLVFMGSDPDGGEVEVRADDISMIKSLSDKESIRGFDPSKSHEAQFQGDEKMARFGKPAAWESVDHEKEEKDDEKKKNSHEWDDRSKKYFKPKKIAQEEQEVQEEGENCPPGYYWCSKSKKCKKKPQDEHDADMRAANAQIDAMAGMPESNGNHWSQMPANQALQDLKKVILNLEPAGDQREAYRDAVDAGVNTEVLHNIIIKAVKGKLLSKEEAQFITGGGGFGEANDKDKDKDEDKRDFMHNRGQVNRPGFKIGKSGDAADKIKKGGSAVMGGLRNIIKQFRAK